MSLSDDIADAFALTKIEAEELERKGLALASSFVDLRSAYSIDYLTESRAYAKKTHETANKTGAAALFGKLTNHLSGNAKKMWKRFDACSKAHDDFTAVCHLHSVSNAIEPTLTQVLEMAHEVKRLRRPEEVAEGRRLFGNLRDVRGRGEMSLFFKI